MELKNLVGLHKLSGVDTAIETVKLYEWSDSTEECYVVRFVLDGITYKAVEDPNDGYRSNCGELIVCEEPITNNFPPQEVMAKMKDNDEYSVNDTIQFIDVVTGKIVLEVGTDNTDCYYPYCVMNWKPENLAINAGR
jgi:hypothetical protein